jgi:hypothetical protein
VNGASVVFKTGSKFSQLDASAFHESGLISFHLLASVTSIDEFCFSICWSLRSITFDPGSPFSDCRRVWLGV